MTAATRSSAVPAHPSARNGVAPEAGFLTHVQALRALAVGIVVVYHLFPDRLEGGYVGVDVFFVISGFLISSHLVRGFERTPRLRIRDFYERRARRLLPASLLVLAFSAVGTFLILPKVTWGISGSQILGSAFYVVNWALAAQSVDYLNGGAAASPVQHYWSLSVEEQFYLVWPLLILGLIFLFRARRRPRIALGFAIAVISLVSLIFSTAFTHSSPDAAYFFTPARIYEFGIGAMVALFPASMIRRRGVKVALSWVGLAAILAATLSFTSATPFPGYLALLPALGAAAFIMGGDVQAWWSPSVVGRRRPVQILGDISYSVYLWHFPLIVFAPHLLHSSSLSIPAKVAVGVVTLIVAWLTHRYVENRFRRNASALPRTGHRLSRLSGPSRALAATVAGMLVIGAGGVGLVRIFDADKAVAQEKLDKFESSGAACVGAAAFDPRARGCSVAVPGAPFPDPILGSTSAFGQGCQQSSTRSELLSCHYGATSGASLKVALVGDSHANQWLTALKTIAIEEHWSLTAFAKSNCAFNVNASHHYSCSQWNALATKALTSGRFDVVITSAAAVGDYTGGSTGAKDGFVTSWAELTRAGVKVIAIADTPRPRAVGIDDIPECVESFGAAKCSLPEAKAVVPSPMADAARASGTSLVNMNDFFCMSGVCPAVAGSELVYRDGDHMTALYSKSLAPYLRPRLDALIASARS